MVSVILIRILCFVFSEFLDVDDLALDRSSGQSFIFESGFSFSKSPLNGLFEKLFKILS